MLSKALDEQALYDKLEETQNKIGRLEMEITVLQIEKQLLETERISILDIIRLREKRGG